MNYTEEQVVKAIRDKVSQSSIRQAAKTFGFSSGYLSDVINRRRSVSDPMAAAFGFKRTIITEVVFQKIA